MKKILIMGLPDSGKTTLAARIIATIVSRDLGSVEWLNADKIREYNNDWDFSDEGRMRQAKRMAMLANISKENFVVADFVAALPAQRETYNADYTVWVDTISRSKYEDTNIAFVPPVSYNIRVTDQDVETWAPIIVSDLINDRN